MSRIWLLLLGPVALLLQTVAVMLASALRAYSRSRLEDLCAAEGRPDRADAIVREEESMVRSAESLAVLSGLVLAALLGALALASVSDHAGESIVLLAVGVAAVCYVAAGAIGRVYAERLLDRLYPVFGSVRILAFPLTFLGIVAEKVAERLWGAAEAGPRPTSFEVEIEPDTDRPEVGEPEIPETARDMFERVVELSRSDVSEIMTPRASMVTLPASVSAQDAAKTFRESGRSRIPLYGESRDDIVGVLHVKDLFARMTESEGADLVSPRKLARQVHLVPETKNAQDLLDELRAMHTQLAVVVDEYGAISGVISIEDLLEVLVGPIADEHDESVHAERIKQIGAKSFEVDAAIELAELNDRLHLDLPTDGDFLTVGGFALHVLGRLPEAGASFEAAGVECTVVEIAEHSIRRVRLELKSA